MTELVPASHSRSVVPSFSFGPVSCQPSSSVALLACERITAVFTKRSTTFEIAGRIGTIRGFAAAVVVVGSSLRGMVTGAASPRPSERSIAIVAATAITTTIPLVQRTRGSMPWRRRVLMPV